MLLQLKYQGDLAFVKSIHFCILNIKRNYFISSVFHSRTSVYSCERVLGRLEVKIRDTKPLKLAQEGHVT